MGDPTLRLFMVEPPRDLVLLEEDGQVTLRWVAPAEQVAGYYVYRKSGTAWERLHESPVTELVFVDSCRGPGTYEYLVKSLQLEQSASGSYYNLSLGITNSIRTTTDLSVLADFSIADRNDGSVQLVNRSRGAQIYTWIFSNGITSAETEPVIEGLLDGELSVTLIASNACQSDTVTQSIFLVHTEDQGASSQVRVFPNPAQQIVTLSGWGSAAQIEQVWIRTLAGQPVLHQNVADRATEIKVDVSALPKAMYVIELKGPSTVYTARLTKQ
jgi:hypothetical protein